MKRASGFLVCGENRFAVLGLGRRFYEMSDILLLVNQQRRIRFPKSYPKSSTQRDTMRINSRKRPRSHHCARIGFDQRHHLKDNSQNEAMVPIFKTVYTSGFLSFSLSEAKNVCRERWNTYQSSPWYESDVDISLAPSMVQGSRTVWGNFFA